MGSWAIGRNLSGCQNPAESAPLALQLLFSIHMRRFVLKSCIALAVTMLVAAAALPQSAASAAQSTSTSTDQPVKAEPQGHTVLIGCLSGPDGDGNYTIRSMTYRTGVEVIGPDDLRNVSGGKVKLTGWWKPSDQPAEASSAKKARKFQVTAIEAITPNCQAPSEKTPVSKEKQQRQQQKQKSSANPPAS